MSDEHGMPVPGEVLTKADFKFCQHAFKWIIPCREIVRRLAELGSIGDRALMYQLVEDAAKLWVEMKGAGDES